MTWLKLTSKALYLMDGDQYLNKVDLESRPNPNEHSIDLPISWFKSPEPPTGIVVALKASAEPTPALEPSPPPAPPQASLLAIHFAAVPNPWKTPAKPHRTLREAPGFRHGEG